MLLSLNEVVLQERDAQKRRSLLGMIDTNERVAVVRWAMANGWRCVNALDLDAAVELYEFKLENLLRPCGCNVKLGDFSCGCSPIYK